MNKTSLYNRAEEHIGTVYHSTKKRTRYDVERTIGDMDVGKLAAELESAERDNCGQLAALIRSEIHRRADVVMRGETLKRRVQRGKFVPQRLAVMAQGEIKPPGSH